MNGRGALLFTLVAWSAFAALGANHSAVGAEPPATAGKPAASRPADAAADNVWVDRSMWAKAACAEAVVVGRIVQVLPPRTLTAKVDDKQARPADWTPVRVAVEQVLLARTPPQATGGAPAKGGALDVLVAWDVPVGVPAAAKPPSPPSGKPASAPSKVGAAVPPPTPLESDVRYVMFLDRVADTKGLAVLHRSACVPADDRSVADATAAVKVDAWAWGPRAGPLQACFLPAGPVRVSYPADGDKAYVDLSGWTVVRNAGPTPIDVLFGKEDAKMARSAAGFVDLTPTGDRTDSSSIGPGRRVRLAPGGTTVVVNGPPNGRCAPTESFTIGVGAGPVAVRARMRVSSINGQAPPAGQEVLLTPTLTENVPAHPFPVVSARRQPAKRVVFVCQLVGDDEVVSVRANLAQAIGAMKPGQSFNVVAFTAGGRLTKLSDKGLVPATPEGIKSADAFLAKLRSARGSDSVALLQAGFADEVDLIHFLTNAKVTGGKLVQAAATLNPRGQTKINTILFERYDKATEVELERVSDGNGGVYRFVRAVDLDP